MSFPLEGIRVIDVSEHGFVPSAAATLAEYGADVIKVERPDGDAIRGIIASGMVQSKDGFDYLFENFNRNKRGIGLDITTEAGRAVLAKLIESADVFITNQLPQVQRKLRTRPEDVFEINPGIVYGRGHGQGQRGPDAELGGFDSVSYWSRGGVGQVLSTPGAASPPVQRPAAGDLPSGTFLVSGICAALVRAARTGQGGIVDTSLLGSAVWAIGPDLAYTSLTGQQLVLDTIRSPLTLTYRTSDGFFVMLMMINEERYWEAATEALGLTELGRKYADADERKAAWAELAAPFAEAITRISRDEISARLGERNCIFSFFATPQEVLEDPAVRANGYLMAHPEYETLRLAASPVQFDNQMPQIRRSAPRLGEHSEQILAEVGYPPGDIAGLIADRVVVSARG
jgi:crotonobetainyl-CoA:carnitine CoA-transferase CaiB-like acyl-CoA transferase